MLRRCRDANEAAKIGFLSDDDVGVLDGEHVVKRDLKSQI